MAERYKSIGMKESQYLTIADKKRVFEDTVGRHFDWGTFLLILVGLQSADELAGKDQNKIVEMHNDENEAANPEDYEEIPGWVSKEEVEGIVRGQADRIIKELKG